MVKGWRNDRHESAKPKRVCVWRSKMVRQAGSVDCNSESESEGHVPGEPGLGAKHSDSGAIASICNAAMVGARMAGTSLFTVAVHYNLQQSV
ncbi:hypothetical protein UNDKW_5821 [Undibacterium sp. KW1]|nr:hypothetical protein UNDKW_5821 [Undibacterium sp. KW1]